MALAAVALLPGVPAKVGDALVATGTARVRPFSIAASEGPHKVMLSQIGATALVGNIEFSVDIDKATYQPLQAFDLTTSATVKAISFEAWPGVSYQINVSTLTTTPADVYATLY